MAERLTTNQEVPGSTPGWIDSFWHSCVVFVFLFLVVDSTQVSCGSCHKVKWKGVSSVQMSMSGIWEQYKFPFTYRYRH